jgi:hypothetical protein
VTEEEARAMLRRLARWGELPLTAEQEAAHGRLAATCVLVIEEAEAKRATPTTKRKASE